MTDFKKTTEKDSLYNSLEKMSTGELLFSINKEDKKVADVVMDVIPNIEKAIEAIVPKMKQGGRLFYLGAGTSGRLGVVDASECPPTFGVSPEKVIGLIAGGDKAIRNAVEFAEDSKEQGWLDLKNHKITENDFVIGITASGSTPYVLSAIEKCNENGILTGGITCNPGSPLAKESKYPMVAEVGPEFVTGSTRMKAGTAQKMILNMISTAVMIKLGHVKGNKMVDMQLSNVKLHDRAERMISKELQISKHEAKVLLEKYGNVRKAIENFKN